MLTIGFLGPEGTFSEKAAQYWQSLINEESNLIKAGDSIAWLFQELALGNLHQIVVPIENSIEGAVNVTQDCLIASSGIDILGEVCLQIRHCLVTKHPVDWPEIKAVYSHPQALAQCYQYLQNKLGHAKFYPTVSTAEAAKIVGRAGPVVAAISSQEAADKYQLWIQDENIQDVGDNKTRFLILAYGDVVRPQPQGHNSLIKTSILVALPHNRPGGLYEILKEFAEANVDLTRIESRPTKKELGEYLFGIDFYGHVDDERINDVLVRLRMKTVMLTVLGSYPVFNC